MHRALALLPVLALAALALAAPEPAPKRVKPYNLIQLNTKADEDEPFLSGSGALYYSRSDGGPWQLMVSTRRRANLPWPAGKAVDGYFSDAADNRGCCLTADNHYPQYLYFATNKDPEKEGRRGDNYDLYVTVRQNATAAFTAPTPVQGVDTPADEMYPWLAGSGKELYFSRKTTDGWRAYVAGGTGEGAGGFSNPKLVDLPAGFHHATLTPDGKTMYLQGPLENERWGLFRSKRTAGGWGKPEPLDALNSPEAPTGDRSPSLSRDGRLLYFASDRPGGKGGMDLWMIPTTELPK
jgi:Tol biopolymer transport system component